MDLPGGMLDKKRRSLRAAGEIKLVQDVADVVLNRLVAQPERQPYFLVRLALGYQRQHAALLNRELFKFIFSGQSVRVLDTLKDTPSHCGVQNGLAGGHTPDRANQIVFVDFLEQVAV